MSIINAFGGVLPDENDPEFNNRMRDLLEWLLGLPGQFNGLTASEFFQVVENALDQTPGRLLRVGSFGLGATDSIEGRLLDGRVPLGAGFYSGAGGSSDLATFPDSSSRYGPIINATRRNGPDVYTIRRVFFSGNRPIVMGSADNGATWSGPNSLYGTDDVVGSVSQSGGTITGAVIERGSNANGEYVRFADGTQICWHVLDLVGGGDVTISANWTFPAGFTGDPVVHLTSKAPPPSGTRERSYWTGSGALSRSLNVSMNAVWPANTSESHQVWAVGRWY
ncbi:hypothetical protein [Tropicibacter sp. R16_0]|uniref:hypothetical protein n=1 Tax=Tropicibacter sp. R16_0 TaxID=2821102 RepID=UPI00336A85E2